jgi:hypothetical protein
MVGFHLTGEKSEDDRQTAANGKSTRSNKRKAAATA